MKGIFTLCISFFCIVSFAQRNMEKLDRGLVAVKVNNGVFLSWRVMGNDPENIAFNVYRNGTKVNANPITGATNIIDAAGTTTATYTVMPIVNGTELGVGATASVWASQVLTLSLNRPAGGTTPAGEAFTYSPNDINVGDLDGDGQYELIVKWYPSNAKDNSQQGYTGNTILDAYKLNGSFLWRIDLGRNIRSGAHYTQFLVADFDQDGKAEVICKTAENTKDGSGNFLSKGPAANDNDNADYRTGGSWAGFVTSGPEYLTIFNGQTGIEMQTVTFQVGRGDPTSWGKTSENYNRVDRFNATIAYLDGKKPSAVFNRGYYAKMTHSAWDWNGTTLSNKWIFNSSNSGNGAAAGQGNHSIMAADIDGDGFDEILMGACAIDHDGKFMWATGHGHGDANHVGDFVPSNPGLEIFNVSENTGSEPDHYMIDARSGRVLWGQGSGNDNGRGMCADIDAAHNGHEAWSNAVSGTKNCNGTNISNSKGSCNFRVYWDGDLQDELLDGNKLDKWNGNGTTRLITLQGQSCNGTKATPNLSADILGDWREEVILHDGASQLYITTTTIPTNYRLYTLMHDPVYRNAISWQQSSYNQPPHLGFNLADFNNVPKPNITIAGNNDCNGVNNGTAYLDNCAVCVGGNTGRNACSGSLQGEDFCTADGVLETINAGFTGYGYVNFTNATGSTGRYSLYSETAKNATIGIRYANGGTTARGMSVSVNGTIQTNFAGNTTGSWTNWNTVNITLNLAQGANLIQLTSTTADGGPNIDMFVLSDPTISAGSCLNDCNGVLGGVAYLDNCKICVGGNTGKTACTQDCEGNWGGSAYVDNCKVCIGTTNNNKACTGTMEAENACKSDGILSENINQGFSGTGYVNTDNALHVETAWNINSTSAQTATLSFRYANGGATSRDGDLYINSNKVASIALPPTGSWSTWAIVSVNVALTGGTSEILLKATTAGGLANLDLIAFSAGVSEGMCVITGNMDVSTTEISIYPNPTQNRVFWKGEKQWILMDIQGKELARGTSNSADLSEFPNGMYFIKLDKTISKVFKN